MKFGQQVNIIERVPLGTSPQAVVMSLAKYLVSEKKKYLVFNIFYMYFVFMFNLCTEFTASSICLLQVLCPVLPFFIYFYF